MKIEQGDSRLGSWEIPAGWVVEAHEWVPDCVTLAMPNHGSVTVDMRRRGFCLGVGAPSAADIRNTTLGFSGRGWRERLLSVAERYLVEVMTP